MTERIFDDRPAVRERTPLLLGLVGPSGTGKTYSALRLATGIQRLTGGEIFVIDTEARRSLHYAPDKGTPVDPTNGKFGFRFVPFGAPFGPLEYLKAIEHCTKKGAKTIIVDSMSHEHEGPGGVLEMHAQQMKELAKRWKTSEDAVNMTAWDKPKSERRRMINCILQIDANFIFCFRAKPKLKIVKGEKPKALGFMPLAGEEFVYEMTARFLLLPGSDGSPAMTSDFEGEREIIKIPRQFRPIFPKREQLCESHGMAMAQWAAGADAPDALSADELIRGYEACSDDATFRVLESSRGVMWARATKDDKARLKSVVDTTSKRLADAVRFQDEPAARDGGFELDDGSVPEDREPGDDTSERPTGTEG
jgi:hypothetical protein